MPTPTYVALAKTVLTGTQANVEFTSIVGTYTDLILTISSRSDRAVNLETLAIQFNNDTAANYSTTFFGGYNSAAYSARDTNAVKIYNIISDGANATASTFGSCEAYIPNYSGSMNKVISVTSVSENNSATIAETDIIAGLWRNTAAITSIKIFPFSGNFVSGSRFDLYGIKNS